MLADTGECVNVNDKNYTGYYFVHERSEQSENRYEIRNDCPEDYDYVQDVSDLPLKDTLGVNDGTKKYKCLKHCPDTAPYINEETVSSIQIKVCRWKCNSGVARLGNVGQYNTFECVASCGQDATEWKLFTEPSSGVKICSQTCVAGTKDTDCRGTVVYSSGTKYTCDGRIIKLEGNYVQCVSNCPMSDGFPLGSGALYDAAGKKCVSACPKKIFKKEDSSIDGECVISCTDTKVEDSNYENDKRCLP